MSISTKCLLPNISEDEVFKVLKTMFNVNTSNINYVDQIYTSAGFIGIENENTGRDIYVINIPKTKKYVFRGEKITFDLKKEYSFIDDSVENIIYMSMGCDYEAQSILSLLAAIFNGWYLADDSRSDKYLKVSKRKLITKALS